MGHRSQVSLEVPNEIVTTRIYDAPRERVWRAFTERGQVETWWGPVGFTTTTHEMDVRTGGRWLHTMHGPDGTDYPNRIVYTKVVAHEWLAWDHDDGASATPMFRCSVRFEDLGANRTRVTLRHEFPSGALRDENIARYGSVKGAIDTTDRLAGQLATMPDPLDVVITRRFAAPPARVDAAWTAPPQLARWWGPRVFRNTVCEADVRVGGTYRITMTGPFPGPGDTDYPVEGEYLEVVPGERLVMTVDCSKHPSFWHDGIRANRAPDDRNPAGTMVQTVSFEPDGDGTRLTIRTRMVSTEVRAAMLKMGMNEGWGETLDRLSELLG